MDTSDRTPRQNLRDLLPYLLRYKGLGALAAIAMAVSVLLQLPLPFLTMYMIDHLIDPKKLHLLGMISMALVGILILRTLSSLLEKYLLTKFRLQVVYDLKQRLYEHLLRMSLDFCHKRQTGYLITRVSGDVEGVQGLFADTFLMVVRNVLTFAVGAVMVFWLNPKLGTMAMLLLPFYLVSLLAFNKRVRAYADESREAYANVFRFLQEHISGIAVIKAFVAEGRDTLDMLKTLKFALNKEYIWVMLGHVAMLAAGIISSLGPILLLWIGIVEIVNGRLTIGGLIACNSFLVYLFSPLSSISSINVTIQNSLACANRVFTFLDQPTEGYAPETERGSKKAGISEGAVEFDRVRFSYDPLKGDVLHDVCFVAPAGAVTAIVGRSGSGKSSLVSLLFRFYRHDAGRIMIDDQEIQGFDLEYLRKNIGLVTQETFLFGYSIMDNIRLGRLDATDEEVMEAAAAAYAHEFIVELPEQYRTLIGERGALISGGERQRIALARVFLKNPRIIVLDEATSSLDSQSERYVKMAMERLYGHRTIITISHRLSTIIDAGTIVLIDKGRVIGIGDHASLYRKTPLYQELYDEQHTEANTRAVP